jgi:thiamine-phosphate pyrophosphorylase
LDSAGPPKLDFQIYLITDRRLIAPRDLPGVCDEILAALADGGHGAGVAIQLREKDLGGRELYQLGAAMKKICSRRGARLFVNDRIDVALAVEADGVHLPADSFCVTDARRLVGRARLIGVSTHSTADVAQAAAEGADFAVFGPVWPPLSKSAYGPARGVEELLAACRAADSMPVFALGGVNAERVMTLKMPGREADAVGARLPAGVAVIGAVFGADDPSQAARSLRDAVGRALPPR